MEINLKEIVLSLTTLVRTAYSGQDCEDLILGPPAPPSPGLSMPSYTRQRLSNIQNGDHWRHFSLVTRHWVGRAQSTIELRRALSGVRRALGGVWRAVCSGGEQGAQGWELVRSGRSTENICLRLVPKHHNKTSLLVRHRHDLDLKYL